MSNVAGKAYGMNVVTPMRPCLTWINRALFMVSRAIPSTLAGPARPFHHSFRALGHHQARSMARSRPGQAVAEERLHAVLQQFQRHLGPVYRRLFRRHSRAGSTCSGIRARDIRIRSRSARSRTTSGRTRSTRTTTTIRSRAPRSATSRRRCASGAPFSIWRQSRPSLSPADFRKQYIAALVGVQNDLGYQGYAPIASVDTDNADRNREDYVQNQHEAAKALV